MGRRLAALAFTAIALASCEKGAEVEASRTACSQDEWGRRRAKTPVCAAEFEAIQEKARADAERNAKVSRPSSPPARDSF